MGVFMNPLHAYIVNDTLFKAVDNKGIEVKKRNPLAGIVQRILGRTVEITIGGEPITVDRESARKFFKNNASRYTGIITDEMGLEEKITTLCSLMRKGQGWCAGLPKGFLGEAEYRDHEGKQFVYGSYTECQMLLNELQQNGFSCPLLCQELLSKKNERSIQFEKDDLFQKIIQENVGRLADLKSTQSRDEVNLLAKELITRMH
jgi:hypothetical protein